MRVLQLLLALPQTETESANREEWKKWLSIFPPLPVGTENGGEFLKAAESFCPERSNNENPELYAVFPYKLYGVGKECLQIGVNTIKKLKKQINVPEEICKSLRVVIVNVVMKSRMRESRLYGSVLHREV